MGELMKKFIGFYVCMTMCVLCLCGWVEKFPSGSYVSFEVVLSDFEV